jgi:hypothetical protein
VTIAKIHRQILDAKRVTALRQRPRSANGRPNLATLVRHESMADFDAAAITTPAKALPRLAGKRDSHYNGLP